jgi:hypothetical protein
MSLPTSQQRALSQIEKALADDHPDLGPQFAIFTGLTGHEAMPVTERVTARPWRSRWRGRIWPTAAAVVGLAVVTVVLFMLSLTLPGRPVCPGTAISSAARTQPVPTGRQLACPTQPSKPSKTSPATGAPQAPGLSAGAALLARRPGASHSAWAAYRGSLSGGS